MRPTRHHVGPCRSYVALCTWARCGQASTRRCVDGPAGGLAARSMGPRQPSGPRWHPRGRAGQRPLDHGERQLRTVRMFRMRLLACAGVAGGWSCSIVIAHRRPDANWADLAASGCSGGTRSDQCECGRLAAGDGVAGHAGRGVGRGRHPDSVRWYAHEVLRLRQDHPAWPDMERQLVTPR
jgi:hypothetical protein